MSREPHIPLFLWIATAIVAHAIWGGGAHQAATVIEETLDIGAFAREVRQHVRLHSVGVEVALLDETEMPSLEIPPEVPDKASDETEPDEADPKDARDEQPEVEKKKKKEKEKPKPAPEKEPDAEKKPENEQEAELPEVVQLKPLNRTAIQQHVEDKNQEDNPDAEYISEHANKVEEETRARITSTDQDAQEATLGGHHVGANQDPGDSDESRIAQSEDSPGDPDEAPIASGSEASPPPTPSPAAAAAPPPLAGPRAPRAPESRPAPAPQNEQHAMPQVHDHASGRWALARPLEERRRQKALPPRQSQKPTDLLGLGASGTTKNGVNLNLSPQMAVAAVGVDQLALERRLDGQRRRSAHLGSWKSMGLERWKPAIENYVATVQPGNQTALNAARSPFSAYLHAIHLRIHPVFADRFLASLDALPQNHPLNRQDMSTHIEIVLSREDGRIVRMGVTKSSGVTAFDVGALESVHKAAPFGAPPAVIISPDGNVYLHWEFHRLPNFACSTHFAHPYILKAAPDSAPPRVTPPPEDPPRERTHEPSAPPSARPGERSGFLQRKHPQTARFSG